MHLKVEMGLELSAVKYIVFDEADRLFEMGFAAQLTEILHAMPTSRQTLLISATLPKSLVEFARAGLQDPKLIRLDADSKVSPDLENAFFTVKSADRDGALLHILEKVVKVPTGETAAAKKAKEDSHKTQNHNKKRKRGQEASSNPADSPTAHSTIVFAATKHRVEYLSLLLRTAGYSVSYVYGNLDQTARKFQVADFRAGLTNILVVTDVAARGIDLPALANVINYDFPSQPKIFVHRVGRTARAGRKGWSYSLVRDSDMPYLIDLQLFLGKRLVTGRPKPGDVANFAEDIVIGSLVQHELSQAAEFVTKLLEEDVDLSSLQSVAGKGEAQYLRTRNSASHESVKRAKELLAQRAVGETHALFDDQVHDVEREKEKMLARISAFRPTETVFEVGKRGNGDEMVEVVRKRREQILRKRERDEEAAAVATSGQKHSASDGENDDEEEDHVSGSDDDKDMEDAAHVEYPDSDPEDDELQISISQPEPKKKTKSSPAEAWLNQDSEFFMSYTPKGLNLAEDRGYGVASGGYNKNTNFVEAARGATMDLTNDESKGFAEASKAKGMRWDKKAKKYVARANDEDGSKGARMIRGESGLKIAASFRSGRFDEWRKANKIGRMPRVGEVESTTNRPGGQHFGGGGGRHYKHKSEKAPKEADRWRDDYHVQKKRVQEAKEKRIGKFKDGQGKNELKGVEDVRKERKVAERRREKNARPSKKKRKF